MLKRFFDFFIFTSLFIAVCAVLMTYQSVFLFGYTAPLSLYGFVFCGTMCSYNFHWYLTPPQPQGASQKLSWSLSNRSLHFILFLAGMVGALVFCFFLLEHWFWLGATAFFTFLYSAPKINHPLFASLKQVAIGKTIFLAFAWMHVTASLPLLIYVKDLQPEHIVFIVNRFFFIYAICILFDYRDVEEDKLSGIKSMITYLDETGIDILFWGSMTVFFGTGFLLFSYLPLVTVLLLLVPGIILSLLYYPSKRNFSDYLYYFILDGLMMLSAPLLLLTKFAR